MNLLHDRKKRSLSGEGTNYDNGSASDFIVKGFFLNISNECQGNFRKQKLEVNFEVLWIGTCKSQVTANVLLNPESLSLLGKWTVTRSLFFLILVE